MSNTSKLPCYVQRPHKNAPSEYREEFVPRQKRHIGELIRLHLLKPRDISALRTIGEGEPSDKVPNWNSGAFSVLSDPFSPPVSDLIFPEDSKE